MQVTSGARRSSSGLVMTLISGPCRSFALATLALQPRFTAWALLVHHAGVPIPSLRPTEPGGSGQASRQKDWSRRRLSYLHQTHERIGIDSCDTIGMNDSPTPIDLTPLAARYGVSMAVMDDQYARRRAGAHDAELINLLTQQDRAGLERERAGASTGVQCQGHPALAPTHGQD